MSDKKIYGVALIGCGHMGAAHMDDIYYKENVQIVSVCDLNEERTKLFKRRYNALRTETDYRNCISGEDVDIVIISTYPSTHLDILKECINHNKHVICEKPITDSLESGHKFYQLVKENPQVKVLVGHILRHNETYNRMAQMIKSGAIGSPIIIRMVQNHHTMDWGKYLALIKETSPIIDCGVHYVDVMQWFTGSKIVDISGVGLRTEGDVPIGKYNYGIMTVKLANGSIGYYEAGWSNTIASDNLKEFVGPKGRISLIYAKDRISNQEEGDLIEYYRYPEKTYEMININTKRKPTGVQFECLINMIENDSPANPSIEDVIDSFSLVIKADEAIKKNGIN